MDSPTPRLIGLTGGIATGKTTVSNYLAEQYNLPVLDADIYAREAVAPGSPILQAILKRYGAKIQTPKHQLDRSALGAIIFTDPQEKLWLEQQIHPFVRDRFTQELEQLQGQTVVLAIPLLFEAHLEDLVTEIWVVACTHPLQLTRLQQRSNLSVVEAQTRINSQLPLTAKTALADLVLHNNSSLEELHQQIDQAVLGLEIT